MLEYFHPWTNSAGFYMARQKGYYNEAGLDVIFMTYDRYWGNSIDYLVRGDVTFAITPFKRVLLQNEQNVPIRSIALINNCSFETIQTLRSKNITRPRDLCGRRVSLHPTKKVVAMLRHIVQQDGGDPDELVLIDSGEREVTPEELRSGIADASYGAYWAWEALMPSTVSEQERVVWRIDELGAPVQPGYVLAVREDTLQKQGNIVRDFLMATRQGYEEVFNDPNSAVPLYEQATPYFDKRLISTSLEAVAPTWFHNAAWGIQRKELFEPYVGWLTDKGIITASNSWWKVVTDKYLSRT